MLSVQETAWSVQCVVMYRCVWLWCLHGARIRVSDMIPRQRLCSASATDVMFPAVHGDWRLLTVHFRTHPRGYTMHCRPTSSLRRLCHHFGETVEKPTNFIGFAGSLVASSTKYDRGPYVLPIFSLWPPCAADADIIFSSCGFFFFLLSFFLSFFPP